MTAADNIADDDGEACDWVVVTGLGTAGTTIVPRDWLDEVLAGQHGTVQADIIGCDPTTGGFTTDPIPIPVTTRSGGGRTPPDRPRPPMPKLATRAYRPTTACRAYVTARDQRCRFPGCTASAYFTDLDHVRPWPTGPTDPRNLACLCRRHHRIKQRPGWRVQMNPDGTMDWTDPTGRVRTTHPVDHLGVDHLATTPPGEFLTQMDGYPPRENQNENQAGFGDPTWDGDYNDPDSYTGGIPYETAITHDLDRVIEASRNRPPRTLGKGEQSPAEPALIGRFHAQIGSTDPWRTHPAEQPPVDIRWLVS